MRCGCSGGCCLRPARRGELDPDLARVGVVDGYGDADVFDRQVVGNGDFGKSAVLLLSGMASGVVRSPP